MGSAMVIYTRAYRARLIRSLTLLYYAVVFFLIALIAAAFGFGGIAVGAAGIAKVLFFLFVILAVVSFFFGLLRRR
jgi:uncharacterized membrane protein YtjA (UPF0391 family)